MLYFEIKKFAVTILKNFFYGQDAKNFYGHNIFHFSRYICKNEKWTFINVQN
jgi:hypothetical protein